jgi:branched-chain amino acid transport system ATP-binding protein
MAAEVGQMPEILQLEGVSKHFGALAAVDDLSFSVREGETYGITGPNGAGKTALFDVITGHSRASAGTVRFRGKEIQTLLASSICQLGMARSFQIPAMFPTQTVLATILAAAHFGGRRRLLARLSCTQRDVDAAMEAAAIVGLSDDLGRRADSLTEFGLKRLMVAAAVATSPDLLMLDEPVGGLTELEAEKFVGVIDKVKTRGTTVVVIEHVMKVLMRISDRVLIMNQGKKISEGSPAEVVRDPQVIKVYLGKTLADALIAEEVSPHA